MGNNPDVYYPCISLVLLFDFIKFFFAKRLIVEKYLDSNLTIYQKRKASFTGSVSTTPVWSRYGELECELIFTLLPALYFGAMV